MNIILAILALIVVGPIIVFAFWEFTVAHPIISVSLLVGAGLLIWRLAPLDEQWKAEQERHKIRKKIRAEEAARREAERLAVIEAEERAKMGLD